MDPGDKRRDDIRGSSSSGAEYKGAGEFILAHVMQAEDLSRTIERRVRVAALLKPAAPTSGHLPEGH